MRLFSEPLKEYKPYREVCQALKKGDQPILINGCAQVCQAHLAANLFPDAACRLIITANEEKARRLYEDLSFFDESAVVYPSRDILFYSADIRGSTIIKNRIEIIKRLAAGDRLTILCGIDVLMEKMMPIEEFRSRRIRIGQETVIDTRELTARLSEMGFENSGIVERPGEFGIRGGIIDIYPLTEDNPVRVELWGDEVDSIRSFNPETQRSIENLTEVVLYPASEMILSGNRTEEVLSRVRQEYQAQKEIFRKEKKREERTRLSRMTERLIDEITTFGRTDNNEGLISYFYDETVFFTDYLPEDTLVFLEEPVRIEEAGREYEKNFADSMHNRLLGGYILPGQADLLFTYEECLKQIGRYPCVLLSALLGGTGQFPPKTTCYFESRSVPSYNGSVKQLASDLKEWKAQGYRLVLLSSSPTRARRLAESLRDYELFTWYVSDTGRVPEPGEVIVCAGRLSAGFEYPEIRFAVFTEKDIFKEKKKRKKKKEKEHQGETIRNLSEIALGDYVVHERYGLGIYRGMEKIERDGIIRDFISIEYGDGGTLFVPASQLALIQRYSGAGSNKPPKLNKIGGNEWEKTKTKVRSQLQIAAKDLVDLYARRQEKKGHAYGPDTVWQAEFEERFPYEETEDQLLAIQDVKRDMERGRIMDRLICGDVGYGKTEVAIRAAFKAVMDSKQVVFLVPTTILAQQHYHSFEERMEHYPIEIAMLSRFCTQAEVNRIKKGLKEGSIDIVIGTHKVLSKSIRYRDLGLLIIDEEQRFGVRQKEKIKRLKEDVDVLSLSATPIPRTLHMSLSGIRDMSVLEIPPVDRRAIQTYVMEYNEEMIREAIARELKRGGQVYYVYNRVSTIPEVRDRVARLVPEAVVEYAHGRMGERQLEDIMTRFINGEIQVIVSTTIIETGLDIPNVNTIIVEDAQRYGLAQLYQLRGRVGRSARNAYAFLLYRRNELLKEQAEKRLRAIREFTDLGSGFRIAMRDLEIRGAGNLLGAEQSGHMEAVGYELYCKMLQEAVRRLQGEIKEEDSFETTIDLTINAYIPAEYIGDETEKLVWYKKIAAISNPEEYEDMTDELFDRYGNVPAPMLRLMDVSLLREKAHKSQIILIEERDKKIHFVMNRKAAVKVDEIDGFLKEYRGKMKIQTGTEPVFVWDCGIIAQNDRLKEVEKVVDRIRLLLE